VPELLASFMPSGGRHSQLEPKAVLLGMLCAIDAGRPAHLCAGWEALGDLPFHDQLRLGVQVAKDGVAHGVTYRQFSQTHQVMIRAIDPSPVPSFKAIAEEDRAAHLAAVREGVDVEKTMTRLLFVLDSLVEASVPEPYKRASSSLAIDWTDHETWSRPRAKDDPQPSNDPDASWGHAKRNAPGAIDHLFFGYYGQVATMVRDEGRGPVPELVRRTAFGAPSTDPAAVMATTLGRAYDRGLSPGDVINDCGYSNREPRTFALALRHKGARLVMDLHPADRGPRGTYKGAICSNGNLYCPCTPSALLELGPLPRQASEEETTAHDERSAELARYKLGRVSKDDEDGCHRVMCPALLKKLRCRLRLSSMSLDYRRPEVLFPPEQPPVCCTQRTITVPEEVLAKTAQKHDYPSKAHRLSYMRRTASERSFAWLQDPASGGMRRGWCRLFGLAKNALMYTLGVVVRNVRIVISFERQRAEDARRAAMGLSPLRRRRRRRRHRDEELEPNEPAPDDHQSEPG
jgi:hypothetical protein